MGARGAWPDHSETWWRQVGGLRFCEPVFEWATHLDPPDPTEVVSVRGWRTFRQVSFGAFGYGATFGLGVRARMPYRVFTLPGPGDGSRLVIDVTHRW